MSTSVQPMTAADLWHLPEDGRRLELVRGELQEMPPAGPRHGWYAARIAGRLIPYVEEHQLGEVCINDSGFVLAHDPDTVRAPDLAFISQARLEALGEPEGYWPEAPDMAIEVISPSDRYSKVAEKVENWLAAGCRMVIVVDPSRSSVEVHRSLTEVQRLSADGMLEGSDVVPGWRMPVAAIFKAKPRHTDGAPDHP